MTNIRELVWTDVLVDKQLTHTEQAKALANTLQQNQYSEEEQASYSPEDVEAYANYWKDIQINTMYPEDAVGMHYLDDELQLEVDTSSLDDLKI